MITNPSSSTGSIQYIQLSDDICVKVIYFGQK